MGRDDELEKQFSDDIDRILAGKETGAGTGADEDSRTALEFASKMADLRAQPSDAFKNQLKDRLMGELERKAAEQASREGQNWLREGFNRLIPRQLVWQALAAGIVLLVIAGGALWWIDLGRTPSPALVSVPSSAPSTVTATAPSAGARLPLTAAGYTDKSTYLTGEKVNIVVTLSNITAEPLRVEPYPPIISIMDDGSQQAVRTFLSGTQSGIIPANSKVSFQVLWDGRDDSGRLVPGGNYYLAMENINHRGQQSLQVDFGTPVRWSILPAPLK